MIRLFLYLLVPFLAWNTPTRGETFRVYIDADFTVSYEVGSAIALGIRTAFSERDFKVAGADIQIIDRNHKGEYERSFHNMESFLNDSQALAFFGGMHSPPYLTNKSYMNQNQLLTLLPWSAAGPITRPDPGDENWIFRLSVDDSKAGRFLIEQALEQRNCERIALLLIDTGWGRVNRHTMLRVLAERGLTPAYVRLFDVQIGGPAAADMVEEVAKAKADCAILLAQATEAAMVSNAFKQRDHKINILSHWAILGARYPDTVPYETREFVGLQILQSCGLRVERQNQERVAQVLEGFDGRIASLSEVSAPAGFVHGYDLTRVFIAAMEQAATTSDWDGSIADKRTAIRRALEDLESPVDGILRVYERPFALYTTDAKDAHEALGADDLCMARYDASGRLEHADG